MRWAELAPPVAELFRGYDSPKGEEMIMGDNPVIEFNLACAAVRPGGEVEGCAELVNVGGQVHGGVGSYRHHHGVGDRGAQQPGHDLDIEFPQLPGGLGVPEGLLEGRVADCLAARPARRC